MSKKIISAKKIKDNTFNPLGLPQILMEKFEYYFNLPTQIDYEDDKLKKVIKEISGHIVQLLENIQAETDSTKSLKILNIWKIKYADFSTKCDKKLNQEFTLYKSISNKEDTTISEKKLAEYLDRWATLFYSLKGKIKIEIDPALVKWHFILLKIEGSDNADIYKEFLPLFTKKINKDNSLQNNILKKILTQNEDNISFLLHYYMKILPKKISEDKSCQLSVFKTINTMKYEEYKYKSLKDFLNLTLLNPKIKLSDLFATILSFENENYIKSLLSKIQEKFPKRIKENKKLQLEIFNSIKKLYDEDFKYELLESLLELTLLNLKIKLNDFIPAILSLKDEDNIESLLSKFQKAYKDKIQRDKELQLAIFNGIKKLNDEDVKSKLLKQFLKVTFPYLNIIEDKELQLEIFNSITKLKDEYNKTKLLKQFLRAIPSDLKIKLSDLITAILSLKDEDNITSFLSHIQDFFPNKIKEDRELQQILLNGIKKFKDAHNKYTLLRNFLNPKLLNLKFKLSNLFTAILSFDNEDYIRYLLSEFQKAYQDKIKEDGELQLELLKSIKNLKSDQNKYILLNDFLKITSLNLKIKSSHLFTSILSLKNEDAKLFLLSEIQEEFPQKIKANQEVKMELFNSITKLKDEYNKFKLLKKFLKVTFPNIKIKLSDLFTAILSFEDQDYIAALLSYIQDNFPEKIKGDQKLQLVIVNSITKLRDKDYKSDLLKQFLKITFPRIKIKLSDLVNAILSIKDEFCKSTLLENIQEKIPEEIKKDQELQDTLNRMIGGKSKGNLLLTDLITDGP